MRYEIERTMLGRSLGPAKSLGKGGVETFIVRGSDLQDALGRVLLRDHAELAGEPVSLGDELLATARNDRGVWLLRFHQLEDRS
ncbi:MAG: hypothetical protein ABR524_03575 [Thermoanaerobaculia bacterium]